MFADWIAVQAVSSRRKSRPGLHRCGASSRHLASPALLRCRAMIGSSQTGPVSGAALMNSGNGSSCRTWRTEIARGFDPGLLARAMAERGMMRVGKDGKPQVKTHPNAWESPAFTSSRSARSSSEGGH